MGRKNNKKSKNNISNANEKNSFKKLSPLKRNEVNHVVKKILKITSQVPSDGKYKWEDHVEVTKLLDKVQEIEPGDKKL